MRRLSVPEHLVRNPKEADRDAARFDSLCSIAIDAARPVMPLTLRRRTAEAGSAALVDEAKSFLKCLLKEPELLKDLPEAELLASLADRLGEMMPELSPELGEEQADDLGRVLMSAWVDLLRSALETYPLLVLANDLLPARVADSSLVEEWWEALEPFGVNDAEVTMIMYGFRKKLLKRKTVELPLNMMLCVGKTAYGPLVMVRPAVLPENWMTDLDLAWLQKSTDCDFRWLRSPMHRHAPRFPGHALGVQGIVHQGQYVYPREVETVLDACPGVAETTIIGAPRRTSDEEVMAIVRPEPGVSVSKRTLFAYCEAELAVYQRPTTIVFTDTFPRDQFGQLAMHEIMAEFTR